ncbi:MAG: hypothetical protein ACLQCB_00945 [Spirochaetia bacterium]
MRANPACLLLLLAALPAGAQTDNRLFVRPWVDLEPVVRIETGEYPIPVEKAARTAMEEARVLLSGMVYGWTFDYTPANSARGVAESFSLTPIAQIPWGSPRLRVVETQTVEQKFWARASYSMDDSEAARRSSWESGTALLSEGEGKANVMKGPAAKNLAFQDAVRDAIRVALHGTYVNAPQRIRGDVVLWEDPRSAVRSGMYRTTATVKIMVREVVPYRIF